MALWVGRRVHIYGSIAAEDELLCPVDMQQLSPEREWKGVAKGVYKVNYRGEPAIIKMTGLLNERESRLLCLIRHENIVRAYGRFVREESGKQGIVEEVAGKPFQKAIKEEPSGNRGVLFAKGMADVLNALSYIHPLGIIHSDIRGKNIMLDRKSEKAKLIDFGVACATASSPYRPILGSCKFHCSIPHLRPPESTFMIHPGDPSCEIYVLGKYLSSLIPYLDRSDDPRDGNISSLVRDITSLMKRKNPSLRPSAQNAFAYFRSRLNRLPVPLSL